MRTRDLKFTVPGSKTGLLLSKPILGVLSFTLSRHNGAEWEQSHRVTSSPVPKSGSVPDPDKSAASAYLFRG